MLVLDDNFIDSESFAELLMNSSTHNLDILSLKNNIIEYNPLAAKYTSPKIKEIMSEREDLLFKNNIKMVNLTNNIRPISNYFR